MRFRKNKNPQEIAQKATQTLWELVMKSGHPSMREVKRCIEQGADLESKNSLKDSLLVTAAREGHAHLIRYFLDQPQWQDVTHPDVPLALIIIASRGVPSSELTAVAKEMIDRGVNPNHQINGLNALSYAADKGLTSLTQLLIDVGADAWSPQIQRLIGPAMMGVPADITTPIAQRWQHAAAFAHDPHVEEVTPQLVCSLANIGKLSAIESMALWQGHEAQLRQVLSQVPPYLCEEILTHMPQLSALLAESVPASVVQSASGQGRMALPREKSL